jgi:hypothetical protein
MFNILITIILSSDARTIMIAVPAEDILWFARQARAKSVFDDSSLFVYNSASLKS